MAKEQKIEAETTKKDYNPNSILFPNNLLILKQQLPYLQRFLKNENTKFLEVFKKIHFNIPFADTWAQIPKYAKFLKVMSKTRKIEVFDNVKLTEECSAIFQKNLPQKLKDLSSFTIPCTIDESTIDKALCDLGASINLLPLSLLNKLGLEELNLTTITLGLANRSIAYARGIIEDVLVRVDKFIFSMYFVVLDMGEQEVPLILGWPFLATGRTCTWRNINIVGQWRATNIQHISSKESPKKSTLTI